jgi:hypothetical protein
MAIILAVIAGTAHASDFTTYGAKIGTVNLPEVGAGESISWFTAAEYFPQAAVAMIDGYEAKGRLIAATGRKIFLQRTYGSSVWDLVATVGGAMDPCFVRVSPDGSKIALGIGYGAPLLVFPTTMLSISNPPLLCDASGNPASGVTAYAENYYDAAWADNQYLVINGGMWPGPPYGSAMGVLDTNNPAAVSAFLVGGIPGASAGVAVDAAGNLYTGIGYKTDPNRTGEIKVWTADEWSKTPASPLDYEVNNRIVATNTLSVAYLGADGEGNLHVGGGDAFGVGGPTENGYAALISQSVIARVTVPGTPGNPADETNAAEYRQFAPDPCADDSATGVLFGNWGRGLAVMWNPTYYENNGTCYGTPGSASDYWLAGARPRLTVYYPEGAPDADGDGIPDSADNAYLTANASQLDTDEDGWGNAADADFNNDGRVTSQDRSLFSAALGSTGTSVYDMNGDGRVTTQDRSAFSQRLGTSAPFY